MKNKRNINLKFVRKHGNDIPQSYIYLETVNEHINNMPQNAKET